MTKIVSVYPNQGYESPAHQRAVVHKAKKALTFLAHAKASKAMSKDPSTKVGAIALSPTYNILAACYNGFPRGVIDSDSRLNDRAKKYPRTVHAEANLVAAAARAGVSLEGCTVLLTSLHPCSQCSGLMIQAGVSMILHPVQRENDRWDEDAKIAVEMLMEAGVVMVGYSEEDD